MTNHLRPIQGHRWPRGQWAIIIIINYYSRYRRACGGTDNDASQKIPLAKVRFNPFLPEAVK